MNLLNLIHNENNENENYTKIQFLTYQTGRGQHVGQLTVPAKAGGRWAQGQGVRAHTGITPMKSNLAAFINIINAGTL